MYKQLAKLEEFTDRLAQDQALAKRFGEDPVATAGEAGIPVVTAPAVDFAALLQDEDRPQAAHQNEESLFYTSWAGIEFIVRTDIALRLEPRQVEGLVDRALDRLPPPEREDVRPYTRDLKDWMVRGHTVWRLAASSCSRPYVTTFTFWFLVAWTPPVCRLS